MEAHSFELQMARNIFHNVVCSAPVTPGLVKVFQVATGTQKCTEDVGRVWIGRSLRQRGDLFVYEGVQLTVVACEVVCTIGGGCQLYQWCVSWVLMVCIMCINGVYHVY